MREVQRICYGVRKLDGSVLVVGSSNIAIDERNRLNRTAEKLGVPQRAQVLKRYERWVAEDGPWVVLP